MIAVDRVGWQSVNAFWLQETIPLGRLIDYTNLFDVQSGFWHMALRSRRIEDRSRPPPHVNQGLFCRSPIVQFSLFWSHLLESRCRYTTVFNIQRRIQPLRVTVDLKTRHLPGEFYDSRRWNLLHSLEQWHNLSRGNLTLRKARALLSSSQSPAPILQVSTANSHKKQGFSALYT